MDKWHQLLHSLIEAEYEKHLYAFEIIGKYLYEAVQYAVGWLDWKEKLVRYFLKMYIEVGFLI
jgi:hypothetical protein